MRSNGSYLESASRIRGNSIILAKNLTLQPLVFAMDVLDPLLLPQGRHEACIGQIVSDIVAKPGDIAKLEFDWPFGNTSPGAYMYKAAEGQVGAWEILQFTVGDVSVLKDGKSGVLA